MIPHPGPLDATHAALVADGTLEPLSPDPGETRRWLDCELASLVENRFFASIDGLALTDAERARWEPRASSGEPLSSPHGQGWFRRAYWLLDEGARAGTFALGTRHAAGLCATVSSLYTLPGHRRRGVAGRALRRAEVAVRAGGGAGVRLTAYWAWQPAVRFYLGLGMWIVGWMDGLSFRWQPDLPAHRIEVGEREATFGVAREGAVEPLLVATRDGYRLGWTELPRLGELRAEGSFLPDRAVETFVVALATRGFPLIRSAEAWRARRAPGGGQPEGLALKIELFEAADRQSGYEIRAPRIPGLAYRDWDDID
jgi:GNAT superfamily N-acetyltransferase